MQAEATEIAGGPQQVAPYVGVRPYTEEERDLFFGRGREALILRNKVFSNPLTVLYAPSGAGKTSLMRTLIVPELRAQGAHVFYFDHWDKDFAANLRRALAPQTGTAEAGAAELNLVEAVRAINKATGQPVVLILDQFEQFLIQHERDPDPVPLRGEIVALLRAQLDLHLVISLREEYLGSLQRFGEQVLNLFQSTYHLDQLAEDQAREAIMCPAVRQGFTWDPDLVGTLIADLQVEIKPVLDTAGPTPARRVALPFLQIVCLRLWREAVKRDQRKIDSDLYRSLGGRAGIIQDYVRAMTAPLGFWEREAAARVLRVLAPPSGTKASYYKEDLQSLTELKPKRLATVLKHLCEHEVVRDRETGDGYRYELCHDALIPILAPWAAAMRARITRWRWFATAAAAVVLVQALIWGAWMELNHLEYRRNTVERIHRLAGLSDSNRQAELDAVGHYLSLDRKLAFSNELIEELRRAESYVPSYYGLTTSIASDQPRNEGDSPLVLEYNSLEDLSEARLQEEWGELAREIATEMGISVPRYLKLVSRPPGPDKGPMIGEMRFKAGPAERPLILPPLRARSRVIVERNFPPRVASLLEKRAGHWPRFKAPALATRWLVPGWATPLWIADDIERRPPEAMIAANVAGELLKDPELFLTADCVQAMLDQLRQAAPRAVANALALPDGAERIRQVLVEMVKQHQDLRFLAHVLEELPKYPDQPPAQVAQRIWEGLSMPAEYVPARLPAATVATRSPGAGIAATQARPASPNIFVTPPNFPEVRVALGEAITARLAQRSELKPEVLRALGLLRRDLCRRFGVIVPGVRFRVDTSLPSDAFRVEVLQREFPVVRADPDRALDAIVTELRFRMAAARKWWLRPDEAVSVLDRVPGETALWLARQYTTGELTFLLRAAMAPEGAREGSRADPFGGAPPEWSIRALPELVPALVFCASTADPQDGRALVACLQKAQAARLGLTHYSAPSGRASELAAAGARALVAGRVSEASQAFRTAAAADAGAAEQSFLAAFPQLAALAQAKRLQDACPLPKPAGNLSAGLSMRADLYDLLAQPAVRVPLELRRRLGIYLVAAEVQANGPAAASGLLEQVLASRREQAWPPAEEYVLAYRLLDTGDRTLRQPVQFDPARNLLDDAFRRWPDRDAEEAFKQLAEYCGSLPEARWCWSMLRPLAELHLRSPNIPYELGWRLADVGGDRQMSETALQMLQLAERNLPALPPQEREARRSVLDWSKAVAHLSLAQYQVKDSLLEAERLLEAGVRNRSSNPGWVQPDLVFGSLAETYMLEGRLPEAAALMEKACGLFPDSPYLMERKFFLRLAQGDAAGARSVAEEMLKANSKEERGIFVMAVIELLTGGSAAETWADRFFQTNHPNRDYVRMMLYWRLRCAGNDRQAQQLLEERWTNITESLKDSSWEQRASQEGATVWREKLIGYYLGKVSRDEIFGPLLDEKKFEASLFRSSGEPLSGLRCEAHFYDALLQGVTGKPQDRDPRQLNQLKKAIASEHVLYYEYQMARYLHGQPPRARVGNR